MQAETKLSIGLKTALLGMPRMGKRVLALAVDAALCLITVWLAFFLRLDEWVRLSGAGFFQPQWAVLASLVIAMPLFITHGFYRVIFRYSGTAAMHMVLRAFVIYTVIYVALVTVIGLPGVPRSVGIMQPMLLLLAVGATRGLVRYWLGNDYQSMLARMNRPKTVIYGAGRTGRELAAAMANSHDMQLVGFLDDDDRLHGHVMNGLRIYGIDDLQGLVTSRSVANVLLALPRITRKRRNQILNSLSPYKVAVSTLPSFTDIAQGKVSISDLRELDIDDLLGREPVQPNKLLLNANTHGKTVVVTGAGGSIGSALCQQIVRTSPKQLLLVDMSEFALYQIHQKLLAFADRVELVPLLASVCDEVRMKEIMHTWKPHTVYHAAAYKHVPMVEHNPAEGVRNNVWGTWVCAEAAARNGVRNFVLVSTDKAVRPTNIMGTTKRLAEMVLQALAEVYGSPRSERDDKSVTASSERQSILVNTSAAKQSIKFSMVRFGNVLDSSGSVVPLFREQIKNGGPITLTHTDITRYFMTIPEAAQLVIQAGAMGQGGDVFVLDMGQPVKIIDLAQRMVELSGLTVRNELNPDGDIELTITGLRPGEKLYEELLIGDNPTPTQHPRIMKAHEQFLSWPQLESKLNALRMAMSVNDVPMIRTLLKDLVSEYQPTGEVVDWVHMALEREVLANE